MYDIKRILVALDLTEIDDTLIEYVARLSNSLVIDKVYFVTVVKQLDLPQEIAKKYPEMLAPVDESIKHTIKSMVQDQNGNSLNCDYEIDVLEGNVTERILHWIKVKNVDLAVVGNKGGSGDHGILTAKLANAAPM